MGFYSAVETCLFKYAIFSGRAPRSEFWYFILFRVLASIVSIVLDAFLFGKNFGFISSAVSAATLLPQITVTVRRLHDTNHSGWWIWSLPLLSVLIIAGITAVGVSQGSAVLDIIGAFLALGALGLGIQQLVWLCSAGTVGPNRFDLGQTSKADSSNRSRMASSNTPEKIVSISPSSSRQNSVLSIVGGICGLAFGRYTGINLLIPGIIFASAVFACKHLFPKDKQSLVAAIAIQVGQFGWLSLALFTPNGFEQVGPDLALMAVGMVWLYFTVSRTAALIVVVYNVFALVFYGYEAQAMSLESSSMRALAVHVALRIGTIVLLCIFMRNKKIKLDSGKVDVVADSVDRFKNRLGALKTRDQLGLSTKAPTF